MNPTVALGIEFFEEIKDKNVFYIDKTAFIREWWESEEKITVITRPRRFGKSLNMNMLNCFFSNLYAGRGDLFEGLEIWKDEKYRALQGTLPVIRVSFAHVKSSTFSSAMHDICFELGEAFYWQRHLQEAPNLPLSYKKRLQRLEERLNDGKKDCAKQALLTLSEAMAKAEKKGVIILLDEFDAPLQEAWANGYLEEMTAFMRDFFNCTFRDNPFLARGFLIGITSVSKESMFSGFNSLRTSTVLARGKYETAFGFTEEEVFAAMDRYGFSDRRGVKKMYDGFIFGSHSSIYNPWDIINYLDRGELQGWWVDTSANWMLYELVTKGGPGLKIALLDLLQGRQVKTPLYEENTLFSLRGDDSVSIWSLCVESGYLKAVPARGGKNYKISIINGAIREMFDEFVYRWFSNVDEEKDSLVKAMLAGDVSGMNRLMEMVERESILSPCESEEKAGVKQLESFYYCFALGLLENLRGSFAMSFNGKRGDGRCDFVLRPRILKKDDGFILGFKAIDAEGDEKELPDAVSDALCRMEEMQHDSKLLEKLPPERIHKYAFVFRDKKVLIDDASGVGRTAYLEKRKKRLSQESRKAPSGQA